jgi:hypothetical protein
VAELAVQRLTRAFDGFDTTVHARAHALCAAQLAELHLHCEQAEQGAAWGRLALSSTTTVHSARLNHTIVRIRGLAAKHSDQAEAKALVEEIDTMTGGDQRSLS